MTADDKSTEVPRLARGVRYRWDEVRGQHQLLYPEGLLVLNASGAAIVALCDGRTVTEIKRELATSFADVQMETDVDEFLDRLAQRGLVRHDDSP